MKPHYGSNFELYQVPDIYSDDALDAVLDGVDGVVHMAMNMDLDPHDLAVIDATIKSIIQLLEKAARHPTIKRIVWTSSMSACNQQSPGTRYKINTGSVNEWAIEEAKKPWDGKGHPTARGIILYAAAKACAERKAWEWMSHHKPHFAFNVVFPDATWGISVSPENQSYKSSAALLDSLVKGSTVASSILPSRWFVDVEDVGLLHMAALTLDEVANERIFACAGPYSWTAILEIMHRRYPDKGTIPQSVNETSFDIGEIDNSRSIEILRKFGKPGFTSLEDTITKAVNQIIECESKNIPKTWIDLYLESVAS
jgi:nucleoside-diphosphate-sugar epimerase